MDKDLRDMFLQAAEFSIIRQEPAFSPFCYIGWRIRVREEVYGKICAYEPGCDMDELERLMKEDAMDTILRLLNGSGQT